MITAKEYIIKSFGLVWTEGKFQWDVGDVIDAMEGYAKQYEREPSLEKLVSVALPDVASREQSERATGNEGEARATLPARSVANATDDVIPAPIRYEILCIAMAIVNQTNETVGTNVKLRQETNDTNFDFAVKVMERFWKEQRG